jgi:hypothetical protein
VQHQQQQSTANYNPFANLNQPVAGNVAVPLSVPHGGLMQPPAPDMMAAMAMQRQQQQLVPMAPNVNVPSPWALHPAVGQQQQQFMPMAPNSNVQSPWVIQPAVGQQLVPMPANATVQSPWAVQGVSFGVNSCNLWATRIESRNRFGTSHTLEMSRGKDASNVLVSGL